MVFKRISTVFFACALMCAGAACGGTPPAAYSPPSAVTASPSPALSPSPETPTPASSALAAKARESTPLDGDDFPAEIEIPVTREGRTEFFVGTLRVSDLGYAVYLLPDFAFRPADDGDVIYPAEHSDLFSTITMKITRASAESPQPEDYENDGLYIRYDRALADALTFEVQFTYPIEAAEGGAVMLWAMWDTLRTGPQSSAGGK